jgi:photosystem II stability/assembly factor-like uncharacterized protein
MLSRTIDGGRHWSHRGTTTYLDWMYFADSKNGVATGYSNDTGSQLALSSDGGNTWTLKKLPIRSAAAASFRDVKRGWIAGSDAGKSVVVARTTDGGSTWAIATPGAEADAEVERLEWGRADRGFLVVSNRDGTTSTVFESRDSGATWLKTRVFDERRGRILVLAFASSDVGIAVSRNGDVDFLLSTVDGGDTWHTERLDTQVTTCEPTLRQAWCATLDDRLVLMPLR